MGCRTMAKQQLPLARHTRRDKSAAQPWEIENVSELAQAAAVKAAADIGAPLGIWPADTARRRGLRQLKK